jgi:hypothetical protein
MEATLGISLYNYLYLKLAKMLAFLLSLMFSPQQNWRRRGRGFCLERGWGWEVAQTMYMHVNKCKNNKIK